MNEALELLESGMLLLSLDEEEPDLLRQQAFQYWHGTLKCGGNRWFEKLIQLIATPSGQLGYVGEHSMADVMPATGLCQYI